MKIEIFAYVDNVDEAVSFYQTIFNATVAEQGTWKNDDGTYDICSFNFDNGTSFSLAKRLGKYTIEGEANAGNTMQMVMLYKKVEVEKLERAYEMLKEGAKILMPLQSVEFTSHTCDLIDKYGLRWCLMVW